jgi:thiamine biosynthesis lipoprotein
MMEPKRTASRRHFITGQAAADELHGLVDRSLDHDPAADGPSPEDTEPYLVRYGRQAMATDFELYLIAGRDAAGPEAAVAALDMVDRLETQLTVYRDTSEVLEINRRAADEPVAVEPRLFDLLQRACALYRETGGAYDLTSGPLSQAWGFSRRQGRVPSDDELAVALANVGGHRVQLDPVAQTVRFTAPGTTINLNSIGKGYTLDRCRELLADYGVSDFLFHGGHSSLLAGGTPASGTGNNHCGWKIGIGHPLRPGQRLAELTISNEAVGTSGASFQFFRYAGKRYGHVLDPRSGRPAEGVFSVTVVAPTAAEADALSTAFYVLGPEVAEKYCAERPEIRYLMLLPAPGGGGLQIVTYRLEDDHLRILQ